MSWYSLLLSVLVVLEVSSALRTGDVCSLERPKKGVCKPITACPSALEVFTTTGRYPYKCEDGHLPIVCCDSERSPAKPQKIVGEKSREYCKKYSDSLWELKKIHWAAPLMNISTCARPPSKPLVTEGEEANAKEFPHQALLGYADGNDKQWQSGGSLISELFVLTAAHCVTTGQFGKVLWVRLGDLDIHKTTDDAQPQEFNVQTIIKHPKYKAPKLYNDIALLKLDSPVKFNKYIAPICLHTEFDIGPKMKRFIATGWGQTKFGGASSSHLMKVVVEHFDNTKCNDAFEPNIRLSARVFGKEIDEDAVICAGGIDSGKDTCQGDSGGPLQVYNEEYYCTYKIVGITSRGSTCGVANKPGLYTRVSSYIEWIEDIVWS